jgi:L-ribulose-5-phosphate 3-epimerase
MSALAALAPGAIFWATHERSALDQIRDLKALGLACAQIGCSGTFDFTWMAAEWKAACEQEDFVLTAVVAAYNGEDYADIPTVERTVGFIPEATRAEREQRTMELCDFAHEIGTGVFACHVGFVPADNSLPVYQDVQAMVRRVCDHCAKLGLYFHLETGQEPAPVLLHFLEDTQRSNLAINFDPANMILYGTGDPIEAMEVLKGHIRSVHVKDGDWPEKSKPGSLGSERPLGEGSVGIPRYLAKLKEIGYAGPLVLEREGTSPDQWKSDIAAGLALVKSLL